MAFPYVALSEGNDKLEHSLFSGFIENCGHELAVNQIAYLESCSVDGKDLKKLQDLQSLQVIKLYIYNCLCCALEKLICL